MANRHDGDPLDDLLLGAEQGGQVDAEVQTAEAVAVGDVSVGAEASAATSGDVGSVGGNDDDVAIDLMPLDLPPQPPPPAPPAPAPSRPQPVTIPMAATPVGDKASLKRAEPAKPTTFLEQLDSRFASIEAKLDAIRAANGGNTPDADQVREFKALLLTMRRQKEDFGAALDEAQGIVAQMKHAKEAADAQFADFQRWFGDWRGRQ